VLAEAPMIERFTRSGQGVSCNGGAQVRCTDRLREDARERISIVQLKEQPGSSILDLLENAT